VRAVYAAHFLEHLPIDKALAFLLEVHRVLGRRGWLRLSTPNLEWVWETHYNVKASADEKRLMSMGANRAFQGWGHKFVWSPALLEEALLSCGFRKLRWCRYGKSRKRFFRNLEQHDACWKRLSASIFSTILTGSRPGKYEKNRAAKIIDQVDGCCFVARGADRVHTTIHIERKLLSVLGVTAIALYTVALVIRWLDADLDDALIVYRMAGNLVNGLGWCFNEHEVFNPSTSVLNPLLIAAIGHLAGGIRVAAHILSGCWIFLSALLTRQLFYPLFKDPWATLSGLGVAHLLGALYVWGLETSLFVFLLLLFVWLEERGRNVWPVGGLLVLARPDGLVVVGLKWVRALVVQRSWSPAGLLQLAAVVAPWVVYSLVRFGRPFADTLHWKVWQGGSGYWGHGRVYLQGLLDLLFHSGPLNTLLFLGAMPGVWLMLKKRSVLLYLVGFSAVQQFCYIVLNVPAYHWYYAVLRLTLLICCLYGAGWAVNSLGRRFRRTAGHRLHRFLSVCGTASIPVLLVCSILSIGWAANHRVRDVRNECYRKLIAAIDRQCPEGTLAALEVGALGFYTDRTIVDLTGLTSSRGEFITGARNDLFFDDPPMIVVLHAPPLHFEEALALDPRFGFLYPEQNDMRHGGMAFSWFLLERDRVPIPAAAFEGHLAAAYQPLLAGGSASAGLGTPVSDEYCRLDSVNGRWVEGLPEIRVSGAAHFKGWAVDPARQEMSPRVRIELTSDGRRWFVLPCGRTERQDIRTHFDEDRYLLSGFEGAGSLLDLPPGRYRIGVVQEWEHGRSRHDVETVLVVEEVP